MVQEEWIEVCAVDDIDEEDVIRFDYKDRSFAICRTDDSKFYATDGYCTHEKFHLANGLVTGCIIECPRHNGRFDFTTGKAKRAPVCVDIQTYPIMVKAGKVFIKIDYGGMAMTSAGMVIVGAGEAGARTTVELRNRGWMGPSLWLEKKSGCRMSVPHSSKAAEGELAPVFVLNQERLSQHKIQFLSGCAVTEIDRNCHLAVLSDGREMGMIGSCSYRSAPAPIVDSGFRASDM